MALVFEEQPEYAWLGLPLSRTSALSGLLVSGTSEHSEAARLVSVEGVVGLEISLRAATSGVGSGSGGVCLVRMVLEH
jgi:hypothetical protein